MPRVLVPRSEQPPAHGHVHVALVHQTASAIPHLELVCAWLAQTAPGAHVDIYGSIRPHTDTGLIVTNALSLTSFSARSPAYDFVFCVDANGQSLPARYHLRQQSWRFIYTQTGPVERTSLGLSLNATVIQLQEALHQPGSGCQFHPWCSYIVERELVPWEDLVIAPVVTATAQKARLRLAAAYHDRTRDSASASYYLTTLRAASQVGTVLELDEPHPYPDTTVPYLAHFFSDDPSYGDVSQNQTHRGTSSGDENNTEVYAPSPTAPVDRVAATVTRFAALHPHWYVCSWGANELAALVTTHYPSLVYAYARAPFPQRRLLHRYCVLHFMGGLTVPTGAYFRRPLDNHLTQPGHFCADPLRGFMFAAAGHPTVESFCRGHANPRDDDHVWLAATHPYAVDGDTARISAESVIAAYTRPVRPQTNRTTRTIPAGEPGPRETGGPETRSKSAFLAAPAHLATLAVTEELAPPLPSPRLPTYILLSLFLLALALFVYGVIRYLRAQRTSGADLHHRQAKQVAYATMLTGAAAVVVILGWYVATTNQPQPSSRMPSTLLN